MTLLKAFKNLFYNCFRPIYFRENVTLVPGFETALLQRSGTATIDIALVHLCDLRYCVIALPDRRLCDKQYYVHVQVRGEDRLFTTGMAVNALLSTWTTFEDKNRRLVWQKGTCVRHRNVVSNQNVVKPDVLDTET